MLAPFGRIFYLPFQPPSVATVSAAFLSMLIDFCSTNAAGDSKRISRMPAYHRMCAGWGPYPAGHGSHCGPMFEQARSVFLESQPVVASFQEWDGGSMWNLQPLIF